MEEIERVELFWHNAKYDKPNHRGSVWVTVAPETQEHGGSVVRAYWDGQRWRSLNGGEYCVIPSRMYPGMEVKAWSSKIPPYREKKDECGRNND